MPGGIFITPSSLEVLQATLQIHPARLRSWKLGRLAAAPDMIAKTSNSILEETTKTLPQQHIREQLPLLRRGRLGPQEPFALNQEAGNNSTTRIVL